MPPKGGNTKINSTFSPASICFRYPATTDESGEQKERFHMSYSFSIKAATKAEAKEAVAAKFDEIVGQQPIHARDRSAVLANASAAIDLMGDDDSKDVTVTASGYVSWTSGSTADDAKFGSVSINCSTGFINRE